MPSGWRSSPGSTATPTTPSLSSAGSARSPIPAASTRRCASSESIAIGASSGANASTPRTSNARAEMTANGSRPLRTSATVAPSGSRSFSRQPGRKVTRVRTCASRSTAAPYAVAALGAPSRRAIRIVAPPFAGVPPALSCPPHAVSASAVTTTDARARDMGQPYARSGRRKRGQTLGSDGGEHW